ncbi:hypothetical protein F2Q69_00058934 [Brassica cretica]|uniref:Uncharacterized protein n=1 Tax=Brassica cretica TaxID=69181 RepID=A0A8S9RGQ7_BRACR|nr:hypothetical protein F2Q69_00058934 [Brassica cretica]
MRYRVRLPDLDAHRLKETQNPSQTLVCLKTTQKIIEKRVKSRKPYIPKHLKREVNKEELEGFHKRVKRVPKDMSFEDAYHKYRLGNFFRKSRETDKDIVLLFNKVSLSIMAIDTAELLGLKMEPSKDSITSVDSSRVKSAGMITNVKELISCIEMFEDAGPTADSNREPAKPESVSFDIRIAASVDIQSSKSINNKPSASDDSQSSESIDTKPSASVHTLRLSEKPKTEKSKSGV